MTQGRRRSIEEVREKLQHIVERRFPDADSIEISGLAVPESGSSSETLLFDVLLKRSGRVEHKRWVLRIQATGFQVYQDPSVARQFEVLDMLRRKTNVAVPRVEWLETDSNVLGAPFFVMERIEGRAPPESYHHAGVLAEATPAEREAMWLSGIEMMARIHKCDPADFAFLDRPELGTTGLDQEIAAWDDYVRWADIPSHPTLERGRRWLADHVPANRPTGLAWGDARLGNIMFNDNRCAALLDWETVSLGGAESDLGWWLYYDHIIAEGFGIPRLKGIGGRDETIAAWEGFMGRKADAMEWHEAFATWRFAVISERAIALSGAAGQKLPVSSGDGNPAVRRLAELIA